MLPWAASLCINLVMVVSLALFALPLLVAGNSIIEVTLLPSPTEQAEEIQTLEMSVSDDARETSPTSQVHEQVTIAEQEIQVESDTPVEDASNVAVMMVDPAGTRANLPARDTLNMPISVAVGTAPPGAQELKQAGTVEEAVDGIGGQIRGLLDQGDTLVVWLFDASLSLVDDRQRIAARLDSVYADIGRDQLAAAKYNGDKPPLLMNAVVAFGGSMAEVVAPTKYTEKAIRRSPTRPSTRPASNT